MSSVIGCVLRNGGQLSVRGVSLTRPESWIDLRFVAVAGILTATVFS
jgi:hypothetical protein